jgi:hypothetical protein
MHTFYCDLGKGETMEKEEKEKQCKRENGEVEIAFCER